MKKYLIILLTLCSFTVKAQIQELAELTVAPGGKYAIVIDSLLRGGVHTGVADTVTRNQIDALKRRVGMWVITLNNSGSDGVKTVWELLGTPLANNGSNWSKVSFGRIYTASHGNKLVGLTDIQRDTAYADTVHSLFSRNGVNTNGLMVTGANQTILTKNNGSAGSALNVVTVASSISDILNFGVQNVTGDNKNYHIIAAPLPTSSGFNSDYNFTMPGASGGLFTTQDLDGNILPAYLTQLRLTAPTTVTGTQYSLVRDSITGVVKQSKVTGGGSVASVSSANTDIGVANPSTTPVLTVNSGIAASQIVKRDAAAGIPFAGISTPSYSQGRLWYDTDNESLSFTNNDSNVSLQIGQEQWIRVINNTGSTISNGTAVYINGSSSGLPTIALAQANSGTTTIGAGLATESIANGATGVVTSLGVVHGLNTSAFSVGPIYLSETTAGALTQTVPVAPNYRYRVGFVTAVNSTTGSIHVTPSTAALGNGSANQLFGMNNAGTAQEVKSIVGSTGGVTVTHTANTITLTTDTASSNGVVNKTRLANTMALENLQRVIARGNTTTQQITTGNHYIHPGNGTNARMSFKTAALADSATLRLDTTMSEYSITNIVTNQGGAGNAITYNGTTQYSTANDAGLMTGNIVGSFAAWVYLTGNYMGLGSYGNSGANNVSVTVASNFIYIDGGGGSTSSIAMPTSISNAWHHIVITCNAGTDQLYVDGVFIGSTTHTLAGVLNGALLNKPTNTLFSTGKINQWLIYNKVLTLSEVLQIYNGGGGTYTLPTTASANLLRRYEYQEGTGSTVAELVSGTYPLTLVNSPAWAGVGNGKVPTSSTNLPTKFVSLMDATQVSADGLGKFGPINGQTWLQGLYPSVKVGSNFVSNWGSWGMHIEPTNTAELVTNDASAALQVVSTTKGVTFPSMTTTQQNAISSPLSGLIVYNSTFSKPAFYNGSAWRNYVVSNQATPSNGQIPIGNGTDATLATITQGSGIVVTNGAGSITIAASSAPLYTSSATSTVTNTTVESDLFSTDSPTMPIATVGKQFRAIFGGIYSTPAVTAGSFVVKVYYGSTVIASGTASALLAGASNLAFNGVVKIVTNSVGASGSVYVDGQLNYSVGNNLARFTLDLNNSGTPVTVTNNAAKAFDVTITWDTASTSKSITKTQLSLESLN